MTSICVFGDSIGRGVVYDGESGRYTVLSDGFSALAEKETGVSMKNLASFGSTIGRGRKIVGRHLGEIKNFERVMLEFGGNDCDFDWASVAENPRGDHIPKTPVSVFEEEYLELVRNVKQAGSSPVLINLPPIDPPRYFAHISRGLNACAILDFLGDKERIYRWHEMYSVSVSKIASMTNTPFIDVRSAFLAEKDCMAHICDDGIHPNAMGHRLISRVVADFIRNIETPKLCLEAL